MKDPQAALELWLSYAEQVLGPCELVRDCTWEHRMSAVLRLRDAGGISWFLKRHRDRERYRAELAAYRQWVPVLGYSAPRLRAASDSRQAIIVTAMPGEPAPWPVPAAGRPVTAQQSAEAAVQHAAGTVLRRLHDAQPALRWTDFGAAKIDEFDRLQPLAAGLLTAAELTSARSEVENLAGLACPGRVPCHRDYTPRNWLVDDGALYVVDFEWSRADVWITDLARLHLGAWADRPDLRDAFLRGYGRELDDTGRTILRGCAVLTAVWLTIKAREIGQPSLEHASRAALQRVLASGR